MPTRAALSHLDLAVADLARSIPVYTALLQARGYRRWLEGPEFSAANPERAAWFMKYSSGQYFSIELRPESRMPLQEAWVWVRGVLA